MPTEKIVECVPNFSEGRDRGIVDAIAHSISSAAGVSLLDVDPGADTNRTVYTFTGSPGAVLAAALAGAKTAYGLIDMSRHSGAHPRMGALDVCPFVPVAGTTMEECVELAREFGAALARELDVPVYLYEKAASRPERTSLADLRAGEYEALAEKLARDEWKPDFGPASFVPRWGATAVGAREFLVAYNVNLNTRDKKLANEVALVIREGGRVAKDADGNALKDASGRSIKLPGLLKEVRAIGWYIEAYRRAQVSINLIDYKTTSLHTVFETTKAEAEKLGLMVTGSEIVGLVPLEPIVEAGRHFLRKMGKSEGASERELIELAVRSLGLDSVAPFVPEKKIVEYAARRAGAGRVSFGDLTLSDFVDEVASESPAPGGGSVAALAGSLGAALVSMAANLTVGKKGYEAAWADMSALAVRAQGAKAALLRAADEDTAAFDELMAATRLPKATEAERASREERLAAAARLASTVPLATAEACLEALRLSKAAAAGGNANSISDAGVAALMARAGVEGAALNVRINLRQAKDGEFAAELQGRCRSLVDEARRLESEALSLVTRKIEG